MISRVTAHLCFPMLTLNGDSFLYNLASISLAVLISDTLACVLICISLKWLKASENCRFTPCTHTHEPGCAVKEAVENGTISYERYTSYLGMLDEETKYRK